MNQKIDKALHRGTHCRTRMGQTWANIEGRKERTNKRKERKHKKTKIKKEKKEERKGKKQ